MSLSVLRVAAPLKPSASIIIVHGLGDSANGWSFFSDMLHQEDNFKHIHFIFPNAPIKPLSVGGGQLVSQWFDIYEFGNPNGKQDDGGYWKSVEEVKKLVQKEIDSGIPSERIMVGGFSQGGAISLGTVATSNVKLGGVICMSGFFGMRSTISDKLKDINKETPIFHGHGDMDPMINIEYARSTAKYFKDLGFKNYNLHEYHGMTHSTCNDEIKDIKQFIEKTIPQI